MTVKLFNELLDMFSKVITGLKGIVNLPRAERDKYRKILSETFLLIDTTLNMVIIRLGEVSRFKDDAAFVAGAGNLDNSADWEKSEREFRLCDSLRVAVSEAGTMQAAALGAVSANDWQSLLTQMRAILAAEREVADYISAQFRTLADAARASNAGGIAQVRADVVAVRETLLAERSKLRGLEIELYSIV